MVSMTGAVLVSTTVGAGELVSVAAGAAFVDSVAMGWVSVTGVGADAGISVVSVEGVWFAARFPDTSCLKYIAAINA